MSYTALEAALFARLTAALAAVTGAPPLELDETRLADPSEDGENRFRAMLVPGRVEPARQQLATPPPFQCITTFRVGLHGVGQSDAARRALVRAMSAAIAAAVDSDWTVNGAASFARCVSLDPDASRDAGFAPENLLDLQIEVEFDAPTRVG